MHESGGGKDATKRTLFWACVLLALLSLLPNYFGAVSAAKSGNWYTGFQHSFDDQMVYSAWMTQAQDGHFLMDNRFAVDQQPTLTVHVYYFALGTLSKVLGIPASAALARAGLSVLFVLLLFRFLKRLSTDTYFQKLALALGVFGGGIGFLVWHDFGIEFTKGDYGPLKGVFQGLLPIDVWQPEAFVFPSMLTNGLFIASLCMIIGIFSCLLDARDSWKPVGWGALWMLLLMNTHSYDALLVALTAVSLFAVQLAHRQMTKMWALRGLLIGCGALPAAAWFVYVLNHDAVFQARAATPTFAPSFRQVAGGLALLMVFACVYWLKNESDEAPLRRLKIGGLGVIVGVAALFAASEGAPQAFWMGLPTWLMVFALAALFSALLARGNPAINLIQSWALVGLIAIYFPGLFQRKLAMGMALPWSILAALGILALVKPKEKAVRIMAGSMALAGMCLSSVFWINRERSYIANNVARTTVQPVFFQPEVKQIMSVLRSLPGRKVVLAMPGVQRRAEDEHGVVPDVFEPPLIADLNPLASGIAGAYTYAGHWSETPHYQQRRAEATRFFLSTTSDQERREILQRSGAGFLIAPVQEAYPEGTFFDARSLGTVLAGGNQYVLIRLSQKPGLPPVGS